MSAIFNADGHLIERRAVLPSWDLKLSDGRMLGYLGESMFGRRWTTKNHLHVLASLDPTQHGRLLHVSMSYKSRDPSWDDIRAVKDAFYSEDIDVMMVIPKKADYVNLHKHTFHLWQTPVEWGIG